MSSVWSIDNYDVDQHDHGKHDEEQANLCTSMQKIETLYISMQCNALADYNWLQRMSINLQDELRNSIKIRTTMFFYE